MDALSSPARAQTASTSTTTRPSTNHDPAQSDAAAPQDLWSDILNSVKSSKAISTKNLVLLGENKSGKSTLLSALASTSPFGLVSGKSSLSLTTPAPTAAASTSKASTTPNDLGLAYAYFDVGDENDRDEIVARVGAYTLHSSEPAYTELLPFAFPEPNLSSTEEETASAMAKLAAATMSSSSTSAEKVGSKASMDAMKDSLVVILLDWEQPWTFLEQLRNWLSILRELVDSSTGGAEDGKWSKSRAALDEMKDRLEAYIRSYVEPSQPSSTSAANGAAPGETEALPSITNVSVSLDGSEANPLSEGTLTDKLGIPLVVVCTKADAIPRLERDKQFKEEQFDYIQQVLRTICMKFGAALFYTSSLRSQSIDILRSYLLHRLFSPSLAAQGAFTFPYRASTTDRDTLLVPAGWDSWGKIKALREPFDAQSMASGWEHDVQVDLTRRKRGLEKSKAVEEQIERELLSDASAEIQSAMKLYEDIVADYEAPAPTKDALAKVRIPDEQSFLAQHHALLAKDPDPRSKFSKRGVVGPMTSSSPALTSEKPKAEARDAEGASRGKERSAAAAAAVAAMTAGAAGERATSPGSATGAVSPGGAPKQSEVLHSFFQSLLKDKGGSGGTPKLDRLKRGGESAAGTPTRRDSGK